MKNEPEEQVMNFLVKGGDIFSSQWQGRRSFKDEMMIELEAIDTPKEEKDRVVSFINDIIDYTESLENFYCTLSTTAREAAKDGGLDLTEIFDNEKTKENVLKMVFPTKEDALNHYDKTRRISGLLIKELLFGSWAGAKDAYELMKNESEKLADVIWSEKREEIERFYSG